MQSDVVPNSGPLQAVRSGNIEVVRTVLLRGARLGVAADPEHAGVTALHLACLANQPDIVALLLREGHDPESMGANGATSLMLAASVGHLHVIDTLIQHNAKVDARHKFAGPG